jgi:hypothetical protein
MISGSLLATTIKLDDAFYRIHHYRVSESGGEPAGYFASLRSAADTVRFRPVKGGVVHDMQTGAVWTDQECLTLSWHNAIAPPEEEAA